MHIAVSPAPFDPARILAGLATKPGDAGAVVTFTGLVRGDPGLTALEIEHYPGMTERAIHAIAQQAQARWALTDLAVVHRFGHLPLGAPIMMVATAAPHRRAAFDAADFLMDYLKSRAPFWKRQIGAHGPAEWVAPKPEDEAALHRWD